MGHYASEIGYYDDEQKQLRIKKKKYEENLRFWQSIAGVGYITGGPVEQHWKAILDWYKAELYDLRFIEDE